jgi:NADH-quinone oxidoreductase subunit G
MTTILINGKSQNVPDGITIIQACELADVEIPRFCYHERLAIAGNCRMCLVEVAGGPPKPVASCAVNVVEGMQIFTNTPMVKKAREGVMEFLLANHPLDCPICDQGGECDLQDQAYQYGKGKSSYHEPKRAVKDKNMGPLIKTQMTRCIHCTRCVRFIEDVAGTCEIGAIGRGENMEITTYLEKNITSELSGNVIDLCPVGALTSKPYAFKSRSWELKKTYSIDINDAIGSNIRIDSRGFEIMRILPILNEEINEEWLSDKARFCYDGLKYQRIDKCYIKKNNKLVSLDYLDALNEIAKKINDLKPQEIGALTGQLSSVEDIFSLKKLLEKKSITNFDCRLNDEKINSSDDSSYLFNSTISGIDEADFCLLIGVNPRKDAPVLNARLRKRFLSKKIKIASLGCDADLTYDYENLGNDLSTLKAIANNQHPLCEIIKSAKKPMLILGCDALSHKDGELIQYYCKIINENLFNQSPNWNGYNFLAKNSGLINGLELGFTSIGVNQIIDKCHKGEIKLLFLHNVDEAINFDKLKDTLIVYIGSHGDVGAHHASIIIPACAFSEKEAIYVNIEGRAQSTKRVVFAPDNVKEDFEIFIDLAKILDIDLGFKNHQQLRKNLAKEFLIFEKLNQISVRKIEKTITPKQLDFSENNLSFNDYNYYLTNSITRASRILSKFA